MRPFPRALLTPGIAALLAVVVFLVDASPAGAHPLGNFTTNRWAQVEVGRSVVRVDYVLDEAELVAVQQQDSIERDRTAFVDAKVAGIRNGIELIIDGERLDLVPVRSALTQPAGQGGLRTLRLEVRFEARTMAGTGGDDETAAVFRDTNDPDLLGWREITVVDRPGLVSASVPEDDLSRALRQYPEGRAPLDVREATFSYRPAATTDIEGDGADPPNALVDDVAGTGDRFVRLVATTTAAPLPIALALLTALAFGGVHAIGPGHGKSVMAAYLVSTSGRRRDAVLLGGAVSLMHTASVLGVAALLGLAGTRLRGDQLYPALTIASGVLVLGVGIRFLLRARAGEASHTHGPGGHVHDSGEHSEHDHHHGHGTHEPGGHDHGGHADHHHGDSLHGPAAPLSRRGLALLATSGGLLPSPSAIVVLLGAFAAGRAALGLALVAAFSVGLALMLTLVGVLLVAGRERLASRLQVGTFRWAPLVSAVLLVLAGLAILVRGVLEFG